jgi:hypothetical protein
VFVGDVVCFTIFLGNSSRKKRFSNLLHQFAHVHHQTFTFIYVACHDSLDPLFQNLGIWIQGSGYAGHVSSVTYFLNLLEDKDKRLKIKLTLSLIL